MGKIVVTIPANPHDSTGNAKVAPEIFVNGFKLVKPRFFKAICKKTRKQNDSPHFLAIAGIEVTLTMWQPATDMADFVRWL